MRKYLVALFLLLMLVLLLIYPNFNRAMMLNSLQLWVVIIIPSFIPMYILSSFLSSYPLISSFTYPILKRIMHFESKKACSLFLLSIITGQPTISVLIQKAIDHDEISLQEGNRLMRFTSMLSPLFIINICTLTTFSLNYVGYLLIGCQIIASMTIAMCSKSTNYQVKHVKPSNHNISLIIDELPYILLNILMIIILVNLLKMPFQLLMTKLSINHFFLTYFIDLFEITTGLSSILNYQISEIAKIVLINITLSITGFCILLQVKHALKKTRLSFTNYFYYRIIHGLVSGIFCLIILLLIFSF